MWHGIRNSESAKNKKIIIFDIGISRVLVSKTSTRMAEKQCISTLCCYNNTITPPDYVMECSGSWGNNNKPLQRLAGVDRTVGSQGNTTNNDKNRLWGINRTITIVTMWTKSGENRRNKQNLWQKGASIGNIEPCNSGRNIALKTMKQGSDRNIGSYLQHQQQW